MAACLQGRRPPVKLPDGLVDVKVRANDEIWSGLKLVWRVEMRAAFNIRKAVSPP